MSQVFRYIWHMKTTSHLVTVAFMMSRATTSSSTRNLSGMRSYDWGDASWGMACSTRLYGRHHWQYLHCCYPAGWDSATVYCDVVARTYPPKSSSLGEWSILCCYPTWSDSGSTGCLCSWETYVGNIYTHTHDPWMACQPGIYHVTNEVWNTLFLALLLAGCPACAHHWSHHLTNTLAPAECGRIQYDIMLTMDLSQLWLLREECHGWTMGYPSTWHNF